MNAHDHFTVAEKLLDDVARGLSGYGEEATATATRALAHIQAAQLLASADPAAFKRAVQGNAIPDAPDEGPAPGSKRKPSAAALAFLEETK